MLVVHGGRGQETTIVAADTVVAGPIEPQKLTQMLPDLIEQARGAYTHVKLGNVITWAMHWALGRRSCIWQQKG